MFKDLKKVLGKVRKGEKLTIKFEFENIDRIDKLEYCNCMLVYPRMKDQYVEVRYTVPSVPEHLKHLGTWKNAKLITVYFTPKGVPNDGTDHTISQVISYHMEVVL